MAVILTIPNKSAHPREGGDPGFFCQPRRLFAEIRAKLAFSAPQFAKVQQKA